MKPEAESRSFGGATGRQSPVRRLLSRYAPVTLSRVRLSARASGRQGLREMSILSFARLAVAGVRPEAPAAEVSSPGKGEFSKWAPVAASGAILVALGLWILSLQSVDLNRINDYGLVSVLPPLFYCALIVLTLSFVVALRARRLSPVVLALHIGALIVMIHATPQILYPTVRYSWIYVHIGIVDYIMRHGTVNPNIGYLDIYHNFPGFFALGALFTESMGLKSALDFAGWAPVLMNLLYLGALLFIYKASTPDSRLIWLAIWFFFLANWVGQDTFAPQALGYFFFLVIIGICRRWFNGSTLRPRKHRFLPVLKAHGRWRDVLDRIFPPVQSVEPSGSRFQRAVLLAIILLCYFAIVSSHQLTPYMTLGAVAGLVVIRRCGVRSLPIAMALMAIAWLVGPAEPYVHRNTAQLFGSFGAAAGNVQGSLKNVSAVPAGQRFVATAARALSVGIGILALIGAVRSLRSRSWDPALGWLVVAPVPWVVATRYGTEVLFRVFYFSLPFLAFYAAAAVYPHIRSGRSLRASIFSVCVSAFLLASLLVTYYGQEEMNYFPSGEFAAAKYVMNDTPARSHIVTVTWNFQLLFHNYERNDYVRINDLSQRGGIVRDPIPNLIRFMSSGSYAASYMYFNRGQELQAYLTGSSDPADYRRIERAVAHSRRFKLVYHNRDASIYKLVSASRQVRPVRSKLGG